MVAYTGKALHAGTLKPLNLPEPVSINEAHDGRPLAINRQRISAVEDTWRLDDEWWRPVPLSRKYYAVSLLSGQRRVIFKDLVTARWYSQSY